MAAPPLGNVVRTERGWEASLPSPHGGLGQLTVGVFASRTMAVVALDLLRLASGFSTGLAAAAIPLENPAQEYLDPQTERELRTFSLPEIVAVVRSFALGGAEAPACGIVSEADEAALAAAGAEQSSGGGGGGEAGHWRGVTRDNTGRHSNYIALLYASVDQEKRPVPAKHAPKTSLYVAACKTAREAAVAHDLAVTWWYIGCAAAQRAAQRAAQAQGSVRVGPSVLNQLNFPSESLHKANPRLFDRLSDAHTLADLRLLLSKMRDSGVLERVAAATRSARASPPPTLDKRGPTDAAAHKHSRPSTGAVPAGKHSGGDGGAAEPGKHGRLHDQPYMGLVKDRQITLHPWRPMICAVVEGHAKPQPRSLVSCGTAEEAAVARDLGWVWVWRRNHGHRSKAQLASLNFAMHSYEKHGSSVLADVARQGSLEELRAYLRTLRDSGVLCSLAARLEPTPGVQRHAQVDPAMEGPSGVVDRKPRSRGSAGELNEDAELAAAEMLHLMEGPGAGAGGGGSGAKRKAPEGAPADNQLKHAGGGAAGVQGGSHLGSEEGDGGEGSGFSSSEHESDSEEDAGAMLDSEDDDWQARKTRPSRKKRRQGQADAGGRRNAASPHGRATQQQQQDQQQQQKPPQRQQGQPPSSALPPAIRMVPSSLPAAGLAVKHDVGAVPRRSNTPPQPSPAAVGAEQPSPGSAVTPGGAAGPCAEPGGGDGEGAGSGGSGGAGRFVGVQRINGSKQATKQWIPRPTVRVADGKRFASKQLTLCYCDSGEEAAVARDLATVWNWRQLGGQEHGGQQRLNFPLARYEAQPGLMRQLDGTPTTEGMQALAKELRDSGGLRRLAAAIGGFAAVPLHGAGPAVPEAVEPVRRRDTLRNWVQSVMRGGAGVAPHSGPTGDQGVSIEVPLPEALAE